MKAVSYRQPGGTEVLEYVDVADPEPGAVDVVVRVEACALNRLDAIQRHRVTHGQFVPVMFTRMLKLPEFVRDKYDVSSMKRVMHAAAPCPVEIKKQMMDWWGPIVDEYYASSEAIGRR